VVKATIGMTMEINRGLAALQMILRWLLFRQDVTQIDRKHVFLGIRRWNNPGWLPFGKVYANLLLVMVISLVYATMAPMVLIGGLMWFLYSQVVYRHSLLFVYEYRFETGGNFFPMVFRRMLYMLLISQGTMCGIFILKGVGIYAGATFLVMGATVYYTFYLTQHYTALNRLPLELAVSFDDEENNLGAQETSARARKSMVPRNNAAKVNDFGLEPRQRRRSSVGIAASTHQEQRRPTLFFDIPSDSVDDPRDLRSKFEEEAKYSQFTQPELLDDAGRFEDAVYGQIAPRELTTHCYGPARLTFLCRQRLHESAHQFKNGDVRKGQENADEDEDARSNSSDAVLTTLETDSPSSDHLNAKVDIILEKFEVNAGVLGNSHSAWQASDDAYTMPSVDPVQSNLAKESCLLNLVEQGNLAFNSWCYRNPDSIQFRPPGSPPNLVEEAP
jgi:hypothetical protein